MQNLENKDKILKIFSKVHCFSKDQLPRYVDGRLTHMEKHLLEQHLVNCELCSEAVEVLQKPKYHTQYQAMGVKVQQYIRSSSHVASVYEAERYQKNVQIKENALTYFWGVIAALLIVVCAYLIHDQVKNEDKQHSFAVEQPIVPAAAPASGPKEPASTSQARAATTGVTATFPAAGTATAQSATIDNATAEDAAEPDKSLYKTAMAFYHDGKLDDAMSRFTQLTADSTSRYREMAHYQLAMCYKFKRQKVKARRMFEELVHMNGRMKKRAQIALNNL